MEEYTYTGLLSWLELGKKESVLLLGENLQGLLEVLGERCHVVYNTANEIYEHSFQCQYSQMYDYIVVINVLEKQKNLHNLLTILKGLLKPTGKLLIGADNRLGMRYMCGECDPYTGKPFESFADYVAKDDEVGGKCFTKFELRCIIEDEGFKTKFYSVLPTLEHPQLIIAEDYMSKENISLRYVPFYRNPDTILFKEEQLCKDFTENGILDVMANSFLIECDFDSSFMDINQITISLNRGQEDAFYTILRHDTVEKRAAYINGEESINNLANNLQKLSDRGIDVVSGKKKNNAYIMPYIDAVMGDAYLRNLLKTNKEKFLEELDKFKQLIEKSSEVVYENEYGAILKDGYIDMVPLNSFFQNDSFIFFDQEFCIKDYPLNAILYRAIIILYENIPEEQLLVRLDEIWKRYNMESQIEHYNKITTEFVNKLRKQDSMVAFYDSHMRNEWVTQHNIDYLSEVVDNMDFYEEFRRDRCFDDLHDKKVFLFGAGKWCEKFIAFYKSDYNICRILDNDESKWGTSMDGIPIESPESIVGEQAAYKVIICVKDYKPIFRQLKRMQVLHIGIYDANYFYAGRQMLSIFSEGDTTKKYHVGYISGTFDVFHIGHINLLRRAKEQCEYLIAAVTSDEYVRTHKNKEPIIPFDERVEMLKACKYVDEVVGVPVKYAGTVEAFQKYHFDCQFCGSDYENDKWWLEQKKFLQEHGADLVFFPYTEQTNSTKIRALIDNNL